MTKAPRTVVSGARWAHEFGSALFAATTELGQQPSDRVAVIVSVASLDRVLEMLLRHFFVATSGASTEECDFLLSKPPLPPIGAAGVRVRLAKCLNLLSKQEANALSFAIDWRNHFAHEPVPSPLTEQVAQGLVDRLPEHVRDIMNLAMDQVPDMKSTGPRDIFIRACIALHATILIRADVRFGEDVPGERPD